MMHDEFFERGDQHVAAFKGLVHYGVGSGAAAMALYNLGAFLSRREPRLLLNAVVYGALWVYEARETLRHRT